MFAVAISCDSVGTLQKTVRDLKSMFEIFGASFNRIEEVFIVPAARSNLKMNED